jgi:teichuronic acid biosynthesis glycosyltransferase TuaG
LAPGKNSVKIRAVSYVAKKDMRMSSSLVSVITPVYNNEAYIAQTIQSVINQTFGNWEMILVDDCSEDHSVEILAEYAKRDSRIKYIKLEQNSGAAVARNRALALSKGRYITYLDADDIWLPAKLERQLMFLKTGPVAFSCCDYAKIDADGFCLNKIVHMPKTMTYEDFLKNTIIQTVGVIIDLALVKKDLLIMPDLRRGQDAATWLQLLRNGIVFRGQNETLAQYRRTPNSLSSNKYYAIKRTWHLYRSVEQLSLLKSCWYLIAWAYHASLKRIYICKPWNKKRFCNR